MHRERKSLGHLYGTSRTLSSFSFFVLSFSTGQNRTTPYFLRRSTTFAMVRACETSRSRSRERGRASMIEGDKSGGKEEGNGGNRSAMCIREPRPSSYSILPVDFVRLTMEGKRKRVCPRLNCVSDNDWKGRFSTQSRRECCSVNRPEINALILFWCLRTLTFFQHSHSNERNNSLILISTRPKF